MKHNIIKYSILSGGCFFDIKYFERNYNYIHSKLE